ncbi:efflux transporter, RND family, MFP subunit [Leadbetterella byssophila DSM 17132]|uniref:Efflux transporter, RND family, MFP subunit n=1 Tax=Leadbetterella byssophila (strain DSM 17132 / JCM 16389 / KACC 11308 / NBRC 106382 / 4M15) TaxID=649349 RepID=E4RZ10_LEAB4|nr:efflux RND transporter periplasmic adaptor subunit [Leadbetterella byssophila]ADQ18229.1 efflux transporter, RND family, MFP subunit [Leadbetterella byssophila DSM 17132]
MKNYILFIALVWAGLSCKAKEEENKEEKDTFLVTYPIIKAADQKSEYVADIHARQNVEVRSKIRGFLERVWVDEGQAVRKGQLLFSLSTVSHQQDVAKAQAQLKIAEADLKAVRLELENAKKLFDKKIISKAELDLAGAKVEAASAKVAEAHSDTERARLNLTFSEIRAPFDGVINRIPQKAGSLVEEGTLLTTLSNNSEVFAYFNVSEKDYLDYVLDNQGDSKSKVTLMLANGMEYPHKGVVETMESEFDRNTGNIAFRARFPNPDKLLKHGGSGKVILNQYIQEAIHIPQVSTFEVQDKLYVYVVKKDNILEQRSIEPILRVPHFYIVDKGVAPDERILFEGAQQVKAGQQIEIKLISAEEVEAKINP